MAMASSASSRELHRPTFSSVMLQGNKESKKALHHHKMCAM